MTQSTTRPTTDHTRRADGAASIGRIVRANLSTAELYEDAVRAGEGVIAAEGPLVVRTGKHTGRSPQDKFIVREPVEPGRSGGATSTSPSPLEHYDRLRARLDGLPGRSPGLRPGPVHRRASRPPPQPPGLHRDRLGQHLRPEPVPPAGRRGARALRSRTSRSSTSRRSRPIPATEGTRTGTAIL